MSDVLTLAGARLDREYQLPRAAIPQLMRDCGYPSVEALMLALLPLAQALAQPPISDFRVGAVGRETVTGDLILGANIEFAGATAADTIHAEQFLMSRAYHRGATLDLIAVSARPCGHCRQFMNEFDGRDALTILDPSGDRLRLAEMLPWSFGPTDLGEVGASPLTHSEIDILSADAEVEADGLTALLAAGRRAYTPYSRAPAAIALRLVDGVIVTGSAIENAAYNPGLAPLQTALINLIAAGRHYADIAGAILGAVPNAAFDHSANTRRLLGLLAPSASIGTVVWRPAPST